MSSKEKLLKIVFPLVIILVGLIGMRLMILFRPTPEKEVMENPGVLVEVLEMKKVDHPVVIRGTGTVSPRREADITPQVSGRVTFLEEDFIAGGFFKEGDLFFRIEDTDYRLAIDRAKAALAKAEFDLMTVESQARVARVEWDRLKLEEKGEPNPLVLYEPQLKNARASVDSARAALAQAELDLSRTSLTAPFDCLVRSEEIDLGQYLQAGRSVATVAGTAAAEINVALPIEELTLITVPRGGSEKKGGAAEVEVTFGERRITWNGVVDRALGEVDPRGRMARLVVSVKDPFQLEEVREEKGPDLKLGMFVDVKIRGIEISNVYPIPRSALRDESTAWIMDDEMRLRVRGVKVLRREREILFVGEGLKEGDLLVLTNIMGAAEGMKLRRAGEEVRE